MARSKVKSRSDYDVAHLHPLTNVPTKYQLPRVSDVNSPVFLQFWFCYIKSQFLFSIFCFNKYGSSLHYPKLKKNLTHLDIGSLRELLLLHTKIYIIYENGCKFAVY